ncbi:DUF4870 domain-containing protein [Catenovulum sp. SM1970]|uniref:DUF4870 domain-containing protein n=1 Tax=Marinifaba aquimaris TaxID=2741323 RepID=UPI0015733C57|nr:DUF4870 domain-containing protein [Marinifaba aquimaris]NTS76801.1 DUF4870 domain-containing protein [Marinifaba aquimaris]
MQDHHAEYWGMPLHTYCMLIHLSQLASIIIPGLGLIMPVVMWLTNKDKNEEINKHGKITVNWIISLLIYSAICGVLTLIFIGAIGFAVLALLNFIFAVVAAIKAKNGLYWDYPMTIKFIK